jgi:hypothetical protein
MGLCVSIPNNVQERQMSVTHRSLLAHVLALRVWDLPLVVHGCYRLRVAPLATVLCSKSFYGCILLKFLDCCNVDKITALIIAALALSLALTRSLQTLSYSDHVSLDTK